MMAWWNKVRNTVMAVATFLNIYVDNVCFKSDGIGCFENKPPYDNAGGLLPMSPKEIDVKFYLYTKTSFFLPEVLTKDPTSILKSRFSGRRKTKFIIHGYRDDGRQTWVTNMKDALLQTEDVNVIVVDWEKGADTLDYNEAAANIRVVGALIAQLITSLNTTKKASYSDMHLIGHSLGAHAAGYAGQAVSGIGRITGLDPAGPAFEGKSALVRLDRHDADFVDVIHTDAEPITSLGFGISQRVGDADFYINSGKKQPGCKAAGLHLFKLIEGKFKDFTKGIGCSHARARNYFIESISSSCIFKAYPCGDEEDFKSGKCPCNGKCARMGYKADVGNPRGKFFVNTNKKSPFCKS